MKIFQNRQLKLAILPFFNRTKVMIIDFNIIVQRIGSTINEWKICLENFGQNNSGILTVTGVVLTVIFSIKFSSIKNWIIFLIKRILFNQELEQEIANINNLLEKGDLDSEPIAINTAIRKLEKLISKDDYLDRLIYYLKISLERERGLVFSTNKCINPSRGTNTILEIISSKSRKRYNAKKPISLAKVNFSRFNLEDKDFKYLDLQGAIFDQCNLNHSNFEKSNLTGASFENANLYGANLKESRLIGCIFSKSILRSCNFNRSDLLYAKLDNQCDLMGANFFEANIQEADFNTATNITCEQIKSACFWKKAQYDQRFYETLKISYYLSNLPNCDFWK